jgi:shikimate kinase
MNIILFGFKGCGKTHFGKLLAKELKRPFIDLDDHIVALYAQTTGQLLSPRQIYQLLGETDFRSLENKAVVGLSEVKNSIIALGGGAVLSPVNRKILTKKGRLVYLQASLKTIKLRGIRLAAGPIEKLYHERKPAYQSIPAPCIPLDNLDEAGVISALCSIFNLEESPHAF